MPRFAIAAAARSRPAASRRRAGARPWATAVLAAGLAAAPAAHAAGAHSAVAELAAVDKRLIAGLPAEGVLRFALTLDRIVEAVNGPSGPGERLHLVVDRPGRGPLAIIGSGPDSGRLVRVALNPVIAAAESAAQADWIVGGIVNQTLARLPGYADDASWQQAQAARTLLLAKDDFDGALTQAGRSGDDAAAAAADVARAMGPAEFQALGFGPLMRKAADIGLTLFARDRLRGWNYDLGDRGGYRVSLAGGVVMIRDSDGKLDNSNKDGSLAGPAVFPASDDLPHADALKFFRGGKPMRATLPTRRPATPASDRPA